MKGLKLLLSITSLLLLGVFVLDNYISIDGFIWKLIIVPIITIIPGLAAYFITKKWWSAILFTLILTIITDVYYSWISHSSVSLSSWCILLPLIVTGIVGMIEGIKIS
ncbi:hypothetical protein [Sutcliffiella rhizosphaerae]|uniref:Uncharacterized protein n=1 Tax=Sutcliffiella rhizosphaerae TaxID=2880967 RepID=A0ABM8YKJ2_9BACI|nr:hypothetical protein [Sutcliffiella rhizosphaerae]CAG9620459.1 hypothetical protein BACCIP111883_01227 [Sutcliffiella rhizosphaerae]